MVALLGVSIIIQLICSSAVVHDLPVWLGREIRHVLLKRCRRSVGTIEAIWTVYLILIKCLNKVVLVLDLFRSATCVFTTIVVDWSRSFRLLKEHNLRQNHFFLLSKFPIRILLRIPLMHPSRDHLPALLKHLGKRWDRRIIISRIRCHSSMQQRLWSFEFLRRTLAPEISLRLKESPQRLLNLRAPMILNWQQNHIV